MSNNPPLAPPSPQDYVILDQYLKAAFQLLEGIADVDEARATLSSYLEYHRARSLPSHLEEFLIQLFFQKCSREFALDTRQSGPSEKPQ